MAIEGIFFGLPLTVLNSLMTQAQAALVGVLTAGQSYAIAGRNFNRANVNALTSMIAELQFAIDRANGAHTTVTFANMNPNPVLSGPQTNYQATAPGG